jgi:hypothetical protein
MKHLLFSFPLLSLLPMMVFADQVVVWPQSEGFYASKGATPSRRVIEPSPNGYPMQQMIPNQSYSVPMGYPQQQQMMSYPSQSGFMPQMPQMSQMPQGFPSSLPSFSVPTVNFPSMPNAMPSYGSMPFSSMPSTGVFPSNGFGNMMPFPGGNSFSGMPFGFGY